MLGKYILDGMVVLGQSRGADDACNYDGDKICSDDLQIMIRVTQWLVMTLRCYSRWSMITQLNKIRIQQSVNNHKV